MTERLTIGVEALRRRLRRELAPARVDARMREVADLTVALEDALMAHAAEEKTG